MEASASESPIQYNYAQTANPALNRSQMTGETSTRSGSYTNAYGYDGGTSTGAGNVTAFKPATANHTYNADNQMSDTGYAYDGNGNPTSYKTNLLTFDAENRMTSYGGTTLTNGYRGDGLRGWKQASGGVKDYFLYDGEQLLGDFNSSGVYSNLYTTGANGLLSRRNVPASASSFYTFDMQGNVVQTMLTDQSPHTEFWFDGYGGLGSGGPFISPDPYSNYEGQWGYYSDSETGLELLTHRFYDRGAGRFVTRDPISYKGGINLYGYTGNNPVNNSDPNGTDYCDVLASQIRDLMSEINNRFEAMQNDLSPCNQYPLYPYRPGRNPGAPGKGTWPGHQDQFIQKQASLRQKLMDFIEFCPGRQGVPDCAWSPVHLPCPAHPLCPQSDAIHEDFKVLEAIWKLCGGP